jgi:hypothetical protein
MTRRSEDNLSKLERALAETHRCPQEPVLGGDWADRVMRDVRRGATGPADAMTARGMVRAVWRVAAVAAVVALSVAASVWVHNGGEAVELIALSDEFEGGAPLFE